MVCSRYTKHYHTRYKEGLYQVNQTLQAQVKGWSAPGTTKITSHCTRMVFTRYTKHYDSRHKDGLYQIQKHYKPRYKDGMYQVQQTLQATVKGWSVPGTTKITIPGTRMGCTWYTKNYKPWYKNGLHQVQQILQVQVQEWSPPCTPNITRLNVWLELVMIHGRPGRRVK